jgi:hypothetical protein
LIDRADLGSWASGDPHHSAEVKAKVTRPKGTTAIAPSLKR